MSLEKLPRVKSELEPLTEDDLEDIDVQTRRAEEFLLYSTGWTQVRIARHFGLAQSTVQNDLRIEMRRRRTRGENIDDEIERIAGVYENVMAKAWARHEEAAESNINSHFFVVLTRESVRALRPTAKLGSSSRSAVLTPSPRLPWASKRARHREPSLLP